MEKDFGKRNDRFLFFFPNKKEKKSSFLQVCWVLERQGEFHLNQVVDTDRPCEWR
jgi:hypothetical protein